MCARRCQTKLSCRRLILERCVVFGSNQEDKKSPKGSASLKITGLKDREQGVLPWGGCVVK